MELLNFVILLHFYFCYKVTFSKRYALVSLTLFHHRNVVLYVSFTNRTSVSQVPDGIFPKMKVYDISEKRDLLPGPAKKRRLDNEQCPVNPASDADIDPPPTVRPGEAAEIVSKKYMHMGIEWGLTGKSPGVLHSVFVATLDAETPCIFCVPNRVVSSPLALPNAQDCGVP